MALLAADAFRRFISPLRRYAYVANITRLLPLLLPLLLASPFFFFQMLLRSAAFRFAFSPAFKIAAPFMRAMSPLLAAITITFH